MMRFFILVCVVMMASSCTSMDALYKNYNTMVNVSDGVDQPEAKLIAQKQLVKTQEKRDYRVTAPDLLTTPQAQNYPDYWFVVFGHNWLSPISTDPLAKTYNELRETEFLVVINKKTGEIVFVGQWHPKRQNDFDWVFDRDAYLRGNPLALPPYEESKPLF